MREIKFRAWLKEADTPILVYQEDMDCVDFSSLYECIKYWNEGSNIMQHTGLKDKKGVEIYEGDIYTGSCDNGNQVVEFDEYSGGWTWHYYENPSNDFEVIGNIYKNPELLETT